MDTSEHTEEHRRAFYDELVTKAAELGYKLGWAGFRYREEYGEFPPREWQPADFREPERSGMLERTGMALPAEVKADVAAALKLLGHERGNKDGWAGYRYKELFGEFPPKAADPVPF